ncbi:MAG TPA: MmcQ/YjbR family DNA-binding protein [Acidimicrobiia bacterium]
MTDPLPRLRSICTSLPEVEERFSHGEPSWFIRGRRQFVTYADHHHDDRLALWCAAPDGVQRILVESAPDKFFVPPYVGLRGWLGVYLDGEVDWVELMEIVLDAYLAVAPAQLAATVREAEGH